MKNIISASKSFFALLGLLSIISISIYTVLALNPKEYMLETGDTISKVLGAKTSATQSLPYLVYDLNNNSTIKTSLKTGLSFGSYVYDTKFDLVKKGEVNANFLKVNNPDESFRKFNITLLIKGNISKDLSISIINNLDEIILYSDGQVYSQFISLDGLSEKSFKIKYSFNENINYPFEIQYLLK